MQTLEDAIILAAQVHRGQFDKAGAPYITHPMRVMVSLGHGASPHERMAAILHDVVEDSEVTLEDLRLQGYPEEVTIAVDHLTKRPEEQADYMAAIRRAAVNTISHRVKLADLADNTDASRLGTPTERDLARIERYEIAKAYLLAHGPVA